MSLFEIKKIQDEQIQEIKEFLQQEISRLIRDSVNAGEDCVGVDIDGLIKSAKFPFLSDTNCSIAKEGILEEFKFKAVGYRPISVDGFDGTTWSYSSDEDSTWYFRWRDLPEEIQDFDKGGCI